MLIRPTSVLGWVLGDSIKHVLAWTHVWHEWETITLWFVKVCILIQCFLSTGNIDTL